MDELSPVSFQNALNNDDANSNSRTYASSDRAGCACKAPERQLLRANNNNYNNGGFTITSSWNQMNEMLKQPATSLLEIACGVKCILGKVKNIQHPCKDVVQQLVNAPDANAPDATSLKEIFTTMNALNTFVNNVEKCDDKIGKLAGLDDEEKTTFGSYIGKIK